MVAFPAQHDTTTKTLLNGAVIPANQTPLKDVEDAVNNAFSHPNVGPYIGKQLIQFLVTSNPSPQYVVKVATAFNDNGQGVRGDLKAVLRTIDLGWLPPNRQSPADVHVVEEVADTTYGGYVGGFPPFRQPSNLCLADRRGWATRPNPAVGEA